MRKVGACRRYPSVQASAWLRQMWLSVLALFVTCILPDAARGEVRVYVTNPHTWAFDMTTPVQRLMENFAVKYHLGMGRMLRVDEDTGQLFFLLDEATEIFRRQDGAYDLAPHVTADSALYPPGSKQLFWGVDAEYQSWASGDQKQGLKTYVRTLGSYAQECPGVHYVTDAMTNDASEGNAVVALTDAGSLDQHVVNTRDVGLDVIEELNRTQLPHSQKGAPSADIPSKKLSRRGSLDRYITWYGQQIREFDLAKNLKNQRGNIGAGFAGGMLGEISQQYGYGRLAAGIGVAADGVGGYAAGGKLGAATNLAATVVQVGSQMGVSYMGGNEMQSEGAGRLAGLATASLGGPQGAIAYGVSTVASDVGSISASYVSATGRGADGKPKMTTSQFLGDVGRNYTYYFGKYFGW